MEQASQVVGLIEDSLLIDLFLFRDPGPLGMRSVYTKDIGVHQVYKEKGRVSYSKNTFLLGVRSIHVRIRVSSSSVLRCNMYHDKSPGLC